jgi:flagellar biosynthetic protein FlhB
LVAGAGLDYLWQKYRFMDRMKMSKQEVKDEHRQIEGDPMIKARLRAIRMEKARRRMMANVANATVVITNPTHYAVALRYDPKEQSAPICLAKGVDDVALRIRAEAAKHEISIIEDPPLARALYASVELDEVIDESHFQAVAKIIGFVLERKKRRSF